MSEGGFIWVEPEDIGTDKDPNHVLWKKLEKKREYRKQNSIAKRLQRRLIALGEDVEEPKRLHPGHHQRSAGAWSWWAKYKNDARSCGSGLSMREFLKLKDEEVDHYLEL
jgi:hypothetical protein